MAFHVAGFQRIQTRPFVDASNKLLLRHAIRHCDPRSFAILTSTSAPDHSTDCIPIPQCITQWLEQKNTDALTSGVAVCSFVKGIATSIGRKKPKLSEFASHFFFLFCSPHHTHCDPCLVTQYHINTSHYG
jgi:hypothetical protein